GTVGYESSSFGLIHLYSVFSQSSCTVLDVVSKRNGWMTQTVLVSWSKARSIWPALTSLTCSLVSPSSSWISVTARCCGSSSPSKWPLTADHLPLCVPTFWLRRNSRIRCSVVRKEVTTCL